MRAIQNKRMFALETASHTSRQHRAAPAKALFSACGALLLALSPPSCASQDDVSPRVRDLYTQAKAAESRGDEAAAIDAYRAMLKVAPKLAAAYNNLGMLYFNRQNYADAAQVLEHGVALDPHMTTAVVMLGLSYAQLGNNAKAEPLLETAAHNHPEDDTAQMALAQTQIGLKKYEQAVPHLQVYLTRHPQDEQALYLLGKTYLQLSEETLGRISQIDPDSAVAHQVAGEIDESMHNYSGAIVEYRKEVEKAPQQRGSHLHLANAYWSLGQWKEAQAEFRAELVNDPHNCTASWKLANALLADDGAPSDALPLLNRAIAECPTLMQARVDRGRAFIKLGQTKAAVEDLRTAEQQSPAEPSIHFFLSTAYKALGLVAEAQREKDAFASLQRKQGATPDDQTARTP